MMLVPRHQFEAASSIARGIHMDSGAVLRHGEDLHPGLAFGSVSVPLDVLASKTRNVYGTGKDLLAQRTSGWYQALGLLAESAASLERRLLTGEGRARQSQLPAWARVQRCGVRVCVECEWEIWAEFGVSAFLWPHLVPFLDACPWHGHLLSERFPLTTRPPGKMQGKPAHPDQLALSESLLSLHAVQDKAAITATCRLALEQADLLRNNGRFRATLFCEVFSQFVDNLTVHPTLRHIATYPLRSREILRWIAGDSALNPVFILLMWMFIEHLGRDEGWKATSIVAVAQPTQKQSRMQRAWRGKKKRQSPVDVRTPYAISDASSLFAMGCTCADVARLCRTSVDTVYRYVRKNDLRAHINAAQRRRLTAEARTVWLRLLRRFSKVSANRLQRIEPRAFRWLYRNDIVWLREHWPELPARRQSIRADATAPHGQDAAMCARIRMARKALKAHSSRRRPSLAALCRQLGVTEYGLQRARRWRRVENAVRDYLGSTNE